MADFDLEHVRRLVVDRKIVFLWDGVASDSVHVTPTVFFDSRPSPQSYRCVDCRKLAHGFGHGRCACGAELFLEDDLERQAGIPDRLLDERKRRLEARFGTREWYLLTEDPLPAEWAEELRGDYGVLIVGVDSLSETRRVLGAT